MDLQVYNKLLSIVTIGWLVLLSIWLYRQYKKTKTPYIYKNLSVIDGQIFLPIKSGKKKFMFLIDTGSTHSLIDNKVAQEMGCVKHDLQKKEQEEIIGISGISDETLVKCFMYSTVPIRIKSKTIEHKMYVVERLNVDGIIGLDLLNKIKARIDTKKGIISIIK